MWIPFEESTGDLTPALSLERRGEPLYYNSLKYGLATRDFTRLSFRVIMVDKLNDPLSAMTT